MKFQLNQKSKDNIRKSTGLEISKISEMSSEEINTYLENRINKKLEYEMPQNDDRLIGRGSILLFLRRFLKLSFIEKKLSRI